MRLNIFHQVKISFLVSHDNFSHFGIILKSKYSNIRQAWVYKIPVGMILAELYFLYHSFLIYKMGRIIINTQIVVKMITRICKLVRIVLVKQIDGEIFVVIIIFARTRLYKQWKKKCFILSSTFNMCR